MINQRRAVRSRFYGPKARFFVSGKHPLQFFFIRYLDIHFNDADPVWSGEGENLWLPAWMMSLQCLVKNQVLTPLKDREKVNQAIPSLIFTF
jgi:hypothetical protein